MEKSGYKRNKLRLRGGGVVVHGMEREFEFEESFTKLSDSSGRMRKRVSVSEYDPDKVKRPSNTNQVKLLGKYDATENLENVEGGGKKLAMVACGSLAFLLVFAVASVVCFKKHSKGTLNDAGPVAYCSNTRRK